jgi:hypothetical protein
MGLARLEHARCSEPLLKHLLIRFKDPLKSNRFIHTCAAEKAWQKDYSFFPDETILNVEYANQPLSNNRTTPLKWNRRARYAWCLNRKFRLSRRLIVALEELLLAQMELYRKLGIKRYRYGFAFVEDMGYSDFAAIWFSNKREAGNGHHRGEPIVKVTSPDRNRVELQ